MKIRRITATPIDVSFKDVHALAHRAPLVTDPSSSVVAKVAVTGSNHCREVAS